MARTLIPSSARHKEEKVRYKDVLPTVGLTAITGLTAIALVGLLTDQIVVVSEVVGALLMIIAAVLIHYLHQRGSPR